MKGGGFVFVLFLILLIKVQAKCDHKWASIDSNHFKSILSNGISAGLFQENNQAYVGRRSFNPIPGRIELKKSNSEFFYTKNMISTNLHHSKAEYLVNQVNHTYEWVPVESEKCIADAVVVNNKYYIGRKTKGERAFIGRVDIGEDTIRYEDDQGGEIRTNVYEVLVCIEDSQQNYEKCKGELLSALRELALAKVWKEELKECKKTVVDLKVKIVDLEAKIEDCRGPIDNDEQITYYREKLTELENENMQLKKQIEDHEKKPPIDLAVDECIKFLTPISKLSENEFDRLHQTIKTRAPDAYNDDRENNERS